MPDPAVEEHRVTGPCGHLDGAAGVRPLDVAPRRPVDPVHQVAARHDRLTGGRHLIRAKCTTDDQVTIAIEPGPLLRSHRPSRHWRRRYGFPCRPLFHLFVPASVESMENI